MPGIFDEVTYDFNEDLYFPGAPQVLADLGIGPAQLVELRWEDIVIETYDNVGIPNWANEAWMGFSAVDANGIPLDFMTQPFPDTFEGGIVGPTSGSMDLTMLDLFSNTKGTVQFLLGSNWDDGSGQPAGSYLSGQLILRFQTVPAPATMALLGLAAGLGRKQDHTKGEHWKWTHVESRCRVTHLGPPQSLGAASLAFQGIPLKDPGELVDCSSAAHDWLPKALMMKRVENLRIAPYRPLIHS